MGPLIFARARSWLAFLLLLWAFAQFAHAAVPNKDATPAYAEEQTMLQVEADSRTPEPGLADPASGRVHVDRHYLGQYGATEGNVIVQRGGNTWREWRNGPLATTAGMILVLALLAIFLFYSAVGPARLDAPESGRRLQRFNRWERWVHWATAISFLLLAATGLVILFGKVVLLPLLGHDIFSSLAYVSKYLHNFAGPLFIVCSVLMFVTFLRRNIPRRVDWQWVRQGGGLVTHKHVPAGFFNAGEKAWFWFGVTLLGLVMSVSGLVLDFAVGQTRYVMQIANYLHLAGATFYIAAAMGHIYIGTLGTPGAYRAMREGYVDEEWARAHHSLWYEEVQATGQGGTRPPPAGHPHPRPGPGNAPRGH
ncbi:formate dehydrogenase subunit gamma [Massilia sp. YMA4]|uniref:Formate dehydrogenase subunit gamma n=1 Tax=[Empedobacter] haloabium TaxID=592317 RepID=A0ABZ1UR58_9BURK|nr:formate dehydrogenase subunit gamma [Massilia sp. YMA4]AXA91545.1 formate dehydrogenase subunit gamma [Massilia sp. YMA4]